MFIVIPFIMGQVAVVSSLSLSPSLSLSSENQNQDTYYPSTRS